MNKSVVISSFNDLIDFLETNEVSFEEVERIVSKTIGVYVWVEDKTKLIQDLKEYWKEYKNKPLSERPIFFL